MEQAGLQLLADGSAKYIADLAAADKATQAFVAGIQSGAKGVDSFGSAASRAQAKITDLGSKIGLQQRQLGILEQELAQTAEKYGESSIQAQKKQLAVDRLTASINKNERELGQLEHALDDGADAFEQSAKQADHFGDIARGAFERVGHAVVDFAGNAVDKLLEFGASSLDMAGDYEQAMNVLQVQSGATDAQMDQVRQTARDLGADLTLPGVSAATAGDAMLELSKGGLDLQNSMDAARGTLQLAAAAETDVATAANVTTGALAAFGMEGEQAGYIADVLTNAANASRIGITDLAQGFQQAAFRFHSAGQGADDLAASLVLLTKGGLSGSDAGTALQNAFARLQAPTDKAAGLMKQLGINVYDANGNMLPLHDIIGVLNGAFVGMTQQERNAALSTIFLGDGMKAMIPLLDAGVDGFDATKDAVNRHGAAAELAAAQMKGLKGAEEGLTSTLESLALEALEPLLPVLASAINGVSEFAGSFSGKLGPAVTGAIDIMGDLFGFIADVGVPALFGLGAATLAYGATQLPVMIAAVTASTTAFGAQAIAMAATAIPLALIAASVAGVVKAYSDLQTKLTDATNTLLNSRQWWTDSAAALDRFGQASGTTKEQLSPFAATIQQLRTDIENDTRALGEHEAAFATFGAASGYSRAQLDAELVSINNKKDGLVQVTDAYNVQEQALLKGAAATLEITNRTNAHTQAEANLAAQTPLTAEELSKLADELDEIGAKGVQAFGTLITSHANFTEQFQAQQATHNATMQQLQSELEAAQTEEQRQGIQERMDAENTAHQESLASAAKAYAEQAAAQRQALGEQLLAYISNQEQMNKIGGDRAAELREKVITEFGVQRDSVAAMFGDMTDAVNDFASNTGMSADDAVGAMRDVEDRAVSLKEKADKLKDKYEMELIAEIDKPGANIDEIRRKLADIPKRVNIEIVTNHIDTYERRGDNVQTNQDTHVSGYRASGGPVEAMHTYMVGERGRELFIPKQDGFVVSAPDTRKLLQTIMNPNVRALPKTNYDGAYARPEIVNNYYGPVGPTNNMPIYTNNTPAIVQQSFAIAQAAML